MFGAESAIRPDLLQRAGASGLWHQLLVRLGNDVETLDDEAMGDECIVGKGTNSMLSNDIKDRMRMRVGMTVTFTQTQLDLDPRSAQSGAHEKVCCARSRKCILCTPFGWYCLKEEKAAPTKGGRKGSTTKKGRTQKTGDQAAPPQRVEGGGKQHHPKGGG